MAVKDAAQRQVIMEDHAGLRLLSQFILYPRPTHQVDNGLLVFQWKQAARLLFICLYILLTAINRAGQYTFD
ncbi:MAG: hypothetical protein J0H07_02260 [Sphingobacteriales bacterium]|nr:hypothetical protein [Sphingobacteriales bacterium]